MTAWDWVGWSRDEFHYIEHWVEAAHRLWKMKAVGILGDLPFYYIRSQLAMRELLGQAGGSDVRGIQIYLVTRFVSWGRKSPLVIVAGHIVFRFVKGCPGFFER